MAEDDPELAQTIARGLQRHAMAVDIALDGEEALVKIDVNEYDVVVLDRDLPRVHGDEVCRRIVDARLPPRILMLTASAGLEHRVRGLGLGADDYLAKPFAFLELVARIRAVGRRPESILPPVLTAGDLRLDVGRLEARVRDRKIRLTTKEFAVLEVLLRAEGGVVSAEELLERAWDENVDPFTASVRVTIANLRRKLGAPSVIETVIGAGYRIMVVGQ